jgi:WD40 repeat protein
MLAVGLSAGCVELFDPITGVQLWDTPALAPAGGTCAKVSPSGAFVGSVVHPGTRAPSTPTQRWQMRDTVSGTVLHDVPTPDGTVGLYTLEFSPCKRWIAAAGDDHRVLVWDLPIGNEVRILETASSYVFSLSFSGDGTLLAAATHAGMTSIWDTATWTQTKYWAGGANVCFSPTNRNLLATTSGDEVFGCKLWDISTHTVVWVFPEADTFAVFSHDGRTLATTIDEEVQSDTSEGADEPGNLLVVCTSTGGTIWLLTGHTEYLTCASFSV